MLNTKKLKKIEGNIIKILNNNPVTIAEFEKIIDDLIDYKSKAFLNFEDISPLSDPNINDVITSISTTLSGVSSVPEDRKEKLWY